MTISSIKASLHLASVYDALVAAYGTPENHPDYLPLGGLIGTMLSQHTSDTNSERAYQQLVTAFPTWEEVRDAPGDKVAEAIRSGGLATLKSVRIQDVLHMLTRQQQAQGGTQTLAAYFSAELAGRSNADALRYLQELPGVGPKTAACVLLFHLGRDAMPVDTHVHRTSQRLGLIGPKVSAERAHVLFANVLLPGQAYPLHVNLIRHGRQVCHARRPQCSRCPLYSECGYVGSVNAQETALGQDGFPEKA